MAVPSQLVAVGLAPRWHVVGIPGPPLAQVVWPAQARHDGIAVAILDSAFHRASVSALARKWPPSDRAWDSERIFLPAPHNASPAVGVADDDPPRLREHGTGQGVTQKQVVQMNQLALAVVVAHSLPGTGNRWSRWTSFGCHFPFLCRCSWRCMARLKRRSFSRCPLRLLAPRLLTSSPFSPKANPRPVGPVAYLLPNTPNTPCWTCCLAYRGNRVQQQVSDRWVGHSPNPQVPTPHHLFGNPLPGLSASTFPRLARSSTAR